MKYGSKSGVMTATGVMLGDLFHITINMLGLALLIKSAPQIMTFLQYFGAAYFIYLGAKGVLTSKVDAYDEKEHAYVGKSESFKRGLFVGLLNVKAMLFYLNFFAVMLPFSLSMTSKVFYAAWVLVMVQVWFTLVALTVGHKKLRSKFLSYEVLIKRSCGAALMFFGTKLLFEKLS